MIERPKSNAPAFLILGLAVVTILIALSGCALLDAAGKRLSLLGVKFGFEKLDVGHLVYPSLDSPLDLVLGNKGVLSGFGVDIVCTLKATNANARQAVFDGVTGSLRVGDTSASAPSISAPFPAFKVPANGETAFEVTFPLRLDQPVFSKSVWKRIVTGADIPYKIGAGMVFKLAGMPASGKPYTSGTRSINLDVMKGTVNAKAAASTALDKILAVLDRAP